jgi:hypothetical protein
VNFTATELRSLGLLSDGLVPSAAGGHSAMLQPMVEAAFAKLRRAAAAEGFDLRIASAFRSFERQRQIWNGKLCGDRPVFDDADRPIDLGRLDASERIECVLRFSAMPGASRHHWGSDMDVFDAAAVPEGYRLRLDLAKVADDGVFGPLHRWIDARIESRESFGFFRPYDRDRGGVAPERWHLSFAPLAAGYEEVLTPDTLRRAWRSCRQLGVGGDVEGLEPLCDQAEDLHERFVRRVARAPERIRSYRS